MSQLHRPSLATIQAEAQELVQQGLLERHQPIYMLCKHIPIQDWTEVERELEDNEFLLRDRIIDLIGSEKRNEE